MGCAGSARREDKLTPSPREGQPTIDYLPPRPHLHPFVSSPCPSSLSRDICGRGARHRASLTPARSAVDPRPLKIPFTDPPTLPFSDCMPDSSFARACRFTTNCLGEGQRSPYRSAIHKAPESCQLNLSGGLSRRKCVWIGIRIEKSPSACVGGLSLIDDCVPFASIRARLTPSGEGGNRVIRDALMTSACSACRAMRISAALRTRSARSTALQTHGKMATHMAYMTPWTSLSGAETCDQRWDASCQKQEGGQTTSRTMAKRSMGTESRT